MTNSPWERHTDALGKTRVAAIVVATLTLLTKPALADYQANVAAIQCEAAHNKLLIRFGWFSGMPGPGGSLPAPISRFSPLTLMGLPTKLTDQWNKIPYQEAGTCRFKNGKKIVVSDFSGHWQNGPFGALVSGSFSMTIDGYHVYTKQEFFPGYGDVAWALSGIEYDGISLLECRPRTPVQSGGEPDPSTDVVCMDASGRLRNRQSRR